jgi:hypothetical protein
MLTLTAAFAGLGIRNESRPTKRIALTAVFFIAAPFTSPKKGATRMPPADSLGNEGVGGAISSKLDD